MVLLRRQSASLGSLIVILLAEQLYAFCIVAIRCTMCPVFLKLQCCYNCVMSYVNSCGTKKLIQKVGFTFESTATDSWLLTYPPFGTSQMSGTRRTVYIRSYWLFWSSLSPIFEIQYPFGQYLSSSCFIFVQHWTYSTKLLIYIYDIFVGC
jgi:hypothetical protein